jgi:cell division protein FtsQ
MHKRIGANKLKKRHESHSVAALRRKGRTILTIVGRGVMLALVCGIAVFGAKSLWTWLETSPRFSVRTIEIRGNVRTGQEEIRRLSRLREGMRMLDIKPAQAEKAILANCWIRQARISRRFPDKVIVTVTERAPIALVNVGRIFYIDDEGVELPLFPGTYSDMPLISGIADSVDKRIPRTAVARIVSLMSAANSIDKSLMKLVSQIDFSNKSFVRIKLENNPLLIEIDDRYSEVQWKRFQELVEAFNNDPEGMPRSINLCYKNLAFAQW